jgi:hypothetical protein
VLRAVRWRNAESDITKQFFGVDAPVGQLGCIQVPVGDQHDGLILTPEEARYYDCVLVLASACRKRAAQGRRLQNDSTMAVGTASSHRTPISTHTSVMRGRGKMTRPAASVDALP